MKANEWAGRVLVEESEGLRSLRRPREDDIEIDVEDV
jgi:hypothetical protein